METRKAKVNEEVHFIIVIPSDVSDNIFSNYCS